MEQNKQEHRGTYRTGSTNPPKSHQGTITALLILVTVLSSIVTVLGMMNIRLWNLLEDQEKQQLESENQIALAAANEEQLPIAGDDSILGMTCQEISGLYRSYNGWPDGLYISQVESGSAADKCDIRPGDILVAINGTPVALQEELAQAVEGASAGSVWKLTVYREEELFTVLLMIG